MKVFFEFRWGPRDGELLEGCPEEADVAEFDLDSATAYFWETGYGAVGSELFVLSPLAEDLPPTILRGDQVLTEHRYRVSKRLQEKDDVWVTAQYVESVLRANIPAEYKLPWYERLMRLGIRELQLPDDDMTDPPFRIL